MGHTITNPKNSLSKQNAIHYQNKNAIHYQNKKIILNMSSDSTLNLQLPPVSYTHLDVYKRQVLSSSW